MYDFSAHFPETDLDFSIFPVHFDGSDPGQIQELSPQQVQQAAQLSQPIQDVSRQWQHYLNALALSGFENWLASRDQNLSIDREHSSIYQPEIAQIIDSVCCVKVGQFKICLINFGKLAGETVQVPRAIFDLPEYTAHFYVLMKVQEELETVIISGFLSHQTWIEQQHQAPLQPNPDWTYSVPFHWFDPDLNRLLLYLRCLDVVAIPLPESVSRQGSLVELASELITRLPQLQPQPGILTPPLWKILSWEQGIVVLSQPQLLQWLYSIQNPTLAVKMDAVAMDAEMGIEGSTIASSSPKLLIHLSDLFKLLTLPTLNVEGWLRNQLDPIATQLSWILTPQFSPAPGMRSTSPLSSSLSASEMRLAEDGYAGMLQALKSQGETIPDRARLAYRDIQVGEVALCLGALTWILDPEEIPEWTLTLILGTPTGNSLPDGLTLRISDTTEILHEARIAPEEECSYLFTRVSGSWSEKFLATISLPSASEITLPPFGFNPAAEITQSSS